MCACLRKIPFYKLLRSHVDIDPRAASRATRAFLREQQAINEAQGVQLEDVPTAEARRIELIVRHPSMRVPSSPNDADAGHRRNIISDTEDRTRDEVAEKCPNTTVPCWRGSAQSNANGSARSPASLGPGGGAPSGGTPGCSHSLASDNPIGHEDGKVVNNLPKEHDTSITDNTCNDAADAVDDDGGTWSDFRPHILHEPHQPVPIAIVNRWPTGSGPPLSLLGCLCKTN